jgi:hypothetical protein
VDEAEGGEERVMVRLEPWPVCIGLSGRYGRFVSATVPYFELHTMMLKLMCRTRVIVAEIDSLAPPNAAMYSL